MSTATDIPYDERNLQVEIPEELMDDTGDVNFVPAPCQVACPIGTDAPSYLAYIWEGNLEAALEAITATNPLSSICGRVCDAPCEPACRRADSDGPIAIRNLKRYVMEKLGRGFQIPPVEVTQKETIAIVGSGPTGLTAAQDLAEAGYEVHIYEMTDRLGGLAIWGIPAFRLPQETIQEDIQRILSHCPGIKVHFNTALGDQVTLDELKDKHDAVLLAIGSWWGKQLGVPGEDDPRVLDGVGYLREINAGARPQTPETVLVVGSGDVAMDACRVAKRLPGCKNVKVIYRRGPDEIPARKDELEGAIKEDIEFVYFTQPVEVIDNGDTLTLRCVKTELGEPEADGRRRPVNVKGSEHDFEAGLIITAVGQKGVCSDLEKRDMMRDDKVITDWDSMRTSDAKVFAAGDGAFGPSTLVNAMFHGHRAAYYVKAFLDGRENPLPYRTPYRTRRVPVSQDPQWESLNRHEQKFHGLGENPIEFPDIESPYTFQSAREEAARCFRCDAENGTSLYTVDNREDIFNMARSRPGDWKKQRRMLTKRLLPRENPFPEGRPATLDDIHFLPANLTRLVIDPYREACKTKTQLGHLELDYPFVIAGFDGTHDDVCQGVAGGMTAGGCPYIGVRSLSDEVPWMQLIMPNGTLPSTHAAALVYVGGDSFTPIKPAARKGRLLGVTARTAALEDAIPFALDNEFDFIVLDGTAGIELPWPELAREADLTVLREGIAILRRLKREGDIAVLYYGGVRSGTDAAKVISMGCDAVILGAAVGIAAGGEIDDDEPMVCFTSVLSIEEREGAVRNFLQACGGEVSMMARCTGKTNIHNLEPEDLRTISIATTEATGIPLIGH
jgi:NADPH-dependent glutamate synthase beta subunit-like oxidoreductase